MRNTILRRIGAGTMAAAVAVGLAACGGDSGDSGSGGGGESATGPIKIGFAVADSGAIAGLDTEATNAALLRISEINAAGGVDGRKLEAVRKNTQSDKALATNVATELVGDGVSAMIVSCDFDYGSPAAIVAQSSKIPGISLCASDPKFADTKTIGNLAFSFAPGSDVEAVSMAEWAFEKKGWKRAYLLQDQSIEYTKALGRYFTAKWEELGGEIVGTDSFPGGDNTDVRAQATKLRGVKDADFVYLPSWNPAAAQVVRQLRAAGVTLPIVSSSAADGDVLPKTAGKVSGVFFPPYGCMAYCSGQDGSALAKFDTAFKKKYGRNPNSAYALAGYNAITAIADSVKAADSSNGEQIGKALENLKSIDSPTGAFQPASPTCHKPIGMPLALVELDQGKLKYVEDVTAKKIVSVGDGNGCVG